VSTIKCFIVIIINLYIYIYLYKKKIIIGNRIAWLLSIQKQIIFFNEISKSALWFYEPSKFFSCEKQKIDINLSKYQMAF